jgi:hypothetical protein
MLSHISRILERGFVVLVLLAIVVGCTESSEKEGIPETHPAYDFYQTAKRGRTTLAVCEAHGGQEIYPNDYEILERLGQGVFTPKREIHWEEIPRSLFWRGRDSCVD